MKILLLSAYHAASHQRWCRGLMEHLPEFDWTCLTLPPRHFNWRIRGNSLTWALTESERLSQNYDLVLATSMVDLSALRGFIPKLGQIPTLVYFHENQFAYPVNSKQFASVEPQMLNIYTAFCGDRLIFNSEFNRQTFLNGAQALIKKLPDGLRVEHLQPLVERSSVIPVPLEDHCFTQGGKDWDGSEPLQLIWNHRWEYDKGPDRLLLALQAFKQIPFRLSVVGQQFRQQPAVFNDIKQLLQGQDALGEWGYVDSEADYRQLLRRSHGVVSTALHDFQGLAVMEAVAAGCIPLVPRRQAYPEWFGEDCCYAVNDDPAQEAGALVAQIQALLDPTHSREAPEFSHFSWRVLADRYRQEIMALVDQPSTGC